MPEKWVEPQVFLRYRGVKIYHVYRHDNYNDVRSYIYGSSIHCTDDGEDTFDVRDLPVPEGVSKSDHAAIIKAAIDAGDLRVIGEQVVLDKDEPEKISYAVFGHDGQDNTFIDIVLAETSEKAQEEVILKRGVECVPVVAITKDELISLAEKM
jgi:hypothetical protein